MEQNTEVTKVIFRRYKEGDVIALFPYDIATNRGDVSCYQHLGQHGAADYIGVIQSTHPAFEADYMPLKKELESIGYRLQVIKRRSRR